MDETPLSPWVALSNCSFPPSQSVHSIAVHIHNPESDGVLDACATFSHPLRQLFPTHLMRPVEGGSLHRTRIPSDPPDCPHIRSPICDCHFPPMALRYCWFSFGEPFLGCLRFPCCESQPRLREPIFSWQTPSLGLSLTVPP